MPQQNRIVRPGNSERTVVTDAGEKLSVPEDWELLPPGDGPLTKMVKAKGPTWLVQVKVRKRLVSKGLWANNDYIQAAKNELELKRSAPDYAKKCRQAAVRRDKKHLEYVRNFHTEVLEFLNFHPRYAAIAARLATSVTELATPIGSRTVARTERIPLEDRARSAVIAWMRHQTTRYDSMAIARVKGRRRQVRRDLASQSTRLLQFYRDGHEIPQPCPLLRALAGEENPIETVARNLTVLM